MNKHIQRGLALALVFGVSAANAALDVSAQVTEIGDAKVGAMAIGAAAFSVAVGIVLYKWLKRAL